MFSPPTNPWLRRAAVSTVGVAMVTVVMGALVTSKNAGMAFRDWPTSDGQNMLTYPWLADFARDWDKFLEHGHRLAGMLIGLWSILLVVVTHVATQQRFLRRLSIAILLGVICQGILGGFRVQLDERGLAMLHGLFASLVFSLMGCMVVLTSRRWSESPDVDAQAEVAHLKPFAVGLVVVLLLQYVLGGLIRHRGSGLHEHLGLGLLLPLLSIVNYWTTRRAGVKWLSRSALTVLLAMSSQALLGLATFVLKYGFRHTGYVAVADSIAQVSARTTHMVLGVIVVMATVTHALKVLRVAAVSYREEPVLLGKGTLASGGAS